MEAADQKLVGICGRMLRAQPRPPLCGREPNEQSETDVMSSSGAPLVPMVQAANLRDRSDVPHSRRLYRT
jgi:hypothetical protein